MNKKQWKQPNKRIKIMAIKIVGIIMLIASPIVDIEAIITIEAIMEIIIKIVTEMRMDTTIRIETIKIILLKTTGINIMKTKEISKRLGRTAIHHYSQPPRRTKRTDQSTFKKIEK